MFTDVPEITHKLQVRSVTMRLATKHLCSVRQTVEDRTRTSQNHSNRTISIELIQLPLGP